jgi:hypothetical protein
LKTSFELVYEFCYGANDRGSSCLIKLFHIVNDENGLVSNGWNPFLVTVVNLPQVINSNGHFFSAMTAQQPFVAYLGRSPQVDDGIELGCLFGPVGVEVIVNGKLDTIHEPSQEAILGKDLLVGFHGALHEQEFGV